jgi:hypothetical protein
MDGRRSVPTKPSDGNVCTRFGGTYAEWRATCARWKTTFVSWMNTCATNKRKARDGTKNGTILLTAVSANPIELGAEPYLWGVLSALETTSSIPFD